MAIDLPVLDDKTYAALLEEARASLGAIHPAWTDHNPSDPGIALIELFAWLTEMLIYRTGRVSEQSERVFYGLLRGVRVEGEALERALDAVALETLRDLRERYRAVTPEDYEMLAVRAYPGPGHVARACCVPERDLSSADRNAPAPGHISLIILCAPDLEPPLNLCQSLRDFLLDRSLITTRVHVVGPAWVPVELDATICLCDDAPDGGRLVREDVHAALAKHLDPLSGGPAGRGWPFGRDVDISDVSAVLDQVSGVEFVEKITLACGERAVEDDEHNLLGLRIDAHELPRVEPGAIRLTLKERQGGRWQTIP